MPMFVLFLDKFGVVFPLEFDMLVVVVFDFFSTGLLDGGLVTDLLIDVTFLIIIESEPNFGFDVLAVMLVLDAEGRESPLLELTLLDDEIEVSGGVDANVGDELVPVKLAMPFVMTLVGMLGSGTGSKFEPRFGRILGMDNSFDNIGFRFAFGPCCWPAAAAEDALIPPECKNINASMSDGVALETELDKLEGFFKEFEDAVLVEGVIPEIPEPLEPVA